MKHAIYRFKPAKGGGHEQQGRRYAIVVTATRFAHMSQWIVVPTSASARAYIFRPEVEIAGGSSRALCDAAVAIDPEVRLGEQIGHLTLSKSIAVDYALKQILDLP